MDTINVRISRRAYDTLRDLARLERRTFIATLETALNLPPDTPERHAPVNPPGRHSPAQSQIRLSQPSRLSANHDNSSVNPSIPGELTYEPDA